MRTLAASTDRIGTLYLVEGWPSWSVLRVGEKGLERVIEAGDPDTKTKMRELMARDA